MYDECDLTPDAGESSPVICNQSNSDRYLVLAPNKCFFKISVGWLGARECRARPNMLYQLKCTTVIEKSSYSAVVRSYVELVNGNGFYLFGNFSEKQQRL
jgi:hypothetical protein